MATDHQFPPRTLGIPVDCIQDIDDDIEEGQILSLITNQIRRTNHSIRRGDTISLVSKQKKYRNDFTQIWDGSKAINLSFQLDDSSLHVPSEFVVTHTDFAPDWWRNVIAHNGIFHLDRSIQDRMKFKQTAKGVYSIIRIGKKTWKCYWDDLDDYRGEKEDQDDVAFTVQAIQSEGKQNETNSFFIQRKTNWQKRESND